ncbi:pilus assembly FimT family protein [Thalassotalea agariperforans]
MFTTTRRATRLKVKGVTLIELLVVITIMMTMITLVGPLVINTINKAEAQSEYLSFCATLRRASTKAFVNGSGILIELQNDTLRVLKLPVKAFPNLDDITEEQLTFEKKYKYLNFNELEFIFNKNGMPNISTINLKQREKNRELNLINLLEN